MYCCNNISKTDEVFHSITAIVTGDGFHALQTAYEHTTVGNIISAIKKIDLCLIKNYIKLQTPNILELYIVLSIVFVKEITPK